jgi:hypothetical protein
MRLILTAVILFVASPVFAQPASWVEVERKRHLPADRPGCWLESGLYDADKLRASMEKAPNCKENLAGLDVDHDKESLIYYHAGSDCHMRVAIKVFRVDAERKYKFILNNIYGGCRAGGWRSGWVVIDKIPTGYELEMHEVKVDRIHGPIPNEGFVFPRPPSLVKREPLETRRVDLTDCLPLTGQSQWILRSRDHIERALDGRPNKATCLERFDATDTDLSTHMLVGYSFATGHCGRPPNLAFKAAKEISSDPTEDRFVVTAQFDGPGERPCKVWTAWPVWLVMPRLPDGYGIRFEARSI